MPTARTFIYKHAYFFWITLCDFLVMKSWCGIYNMQIKHFYILRYLSMNLTWDNELFLQTFRHLNYLSEVVWVIGGHHEGSIVQQEADSIVHVLTAVDRVAGLGRSVHQSEQEVMVHNGPNHCNTNTNINCVKGA